jgi:hypothetical protein
MAHYTFKNSYTRLIARLNLSPQGDAAFGCSVQDSGNALQPERSRLPLFLTKKYPGIVLRWKSGLRYLQKKPCGMILII